MFLLQSCFVSAYIWSVFLWSIASSDCGSRGWHGLSGSWSRSEKESGHHLHVTNSMLTFLPSSPLENDWNGYASITLPAPAVAFVSNHPDSALNRMALTWNTPPGQLLLLSGHTHLASRWRWRCDARRRSARATSSSPPPPPPTPASSPAAT